MEKPVSWLKLLELASGLVGTIREFVLEQFHLLHLLHMHTQC